MGKYRTSDLSLSAFLIARGHKLTRMERGPRGVFVFSDSDDLQQDLLCWGNNEPIAIAVRTFVNSMRDLKGMVGTAA